MAKGSLPDELIKKFKDIAKNQTRSPDVFLNEEREEYRKLVLNAHANIEHLLGLLIGTYFTRKNPNPIIVERVDTILGHLDYGTKVNILKDFGWSNNKDDEKILWKAIEIAKYRNAVAHLRKNDDRRLATKETIDKITSLEEEVEDKLLLAITANDPRMLAPMQAVVADYLNEFQQERYEDLKKEALKKRINRD